MTSVSSVADNRNKRPFCGRLLACHGAYHAVAVRSVPLHGTVAAARLFK